LLKKHEGRTFSWASNATYVCSNQVQGAEIEGCDSSKYQGRFPLSQGGFTMTVWEITNKWMNDYASLDRTPEDSINPKFEKQFGGDGSPLKWKKRPKFVVPVEKNKKKPRPRSDITTITLPGPILNEKARGALGDFLSQFGQLLELDVDGQVEYYYNVTNIVPCLDQDRSEKNSIGVVRKPVFSVSTTPNTPAVFKLPLSPVRIYVNDGAKEILEERIAKHGLIGMSFAERETA
jgi:hypothetical protein